MKPFEIILAEDSPGDAMLVRVALREAAVDCKLLQVEDGEKAIALIESLNANSRPPNIDLLLLDLNLPKRDGEEVLRRLRSIERYAQTPVVVMTASSAPEAYQKAQEHAVLHYFRKPSNLAGFMKLGKVVRDVLYPNGSPDREPPPRAATHGGAA